MLLQAMGQMGRINFEVVGLVVLITLISATVYIQYIQYIYTSKN